MPERPRVLVTADGPQVRGPLVSVRALAAGGYRASIALSCRSSLAQSSRACERVYRVPDVSDPGYAGAVHRIVEREGFLTVVPGTEVAVLALGIGPPDLVDKGRLAERCERVGIPSPPTRIIEDRPALLAAAEGFEYPVILKPALKRANAVRCDSPADVAATAYEDPVLVQPYLTSAPGAVAGVLWRDRLVGAVHERWLRTWKIDCGGPSSAFTVEPDRELEGRLAHLMEGFEGLFNAQFIGPYLIDLNLHPSTTQPLGVKAGANLIAIWCDLLRGARVPEVRGRPGVHYRWLEGDLRSVAAALRRRRIGPREALRALRPRRGTAHATESLRDPMPMLRRGAYLARRTLGMPR